MKEPEIFLTARWQDLVLITFDADPEILQPHIPKGFEPDTIDSRGFLSLVAFDFLDTRVKGIKVPYHINFPEINLRIYVKNNDKRGVVFVREFVPRSIISFIANTIYNENYRTAKMKSSVTKNGSVFVNHSLNISKRKYEIELEALNKPYLPPAESIEHFFKEHEWGFGTTKRGKTLIYKVEHPFWNIYPVKKFQHNIDFSAVYGKKWEFLNSMSPYNVTFAQGSEIKVFQGQIL